MEITLMIRLLWMVVLIAINTYHGDIEATKDEKIKEWEMDKDRPDTNTFRYTCPWPPYMVGNNSRCQETCGKQSAFLRPDTLQLVCFTSVERATVCNRSKTVVEDVAQTLCECGMQVRSKSRQEYSTTCADIPYQMRTLKKEGGSCQTGCQRVGIFVTKRRPLYDLEWCHYERDTSIFNVVKLQGALNGIKIENNKNKYKCWCGVATTHNVEPSLRAPMPNAHIKEVTLKFNPDKDNTTNQTKRHREVRNNSRGNSSAQRKLKKQKQHSKSFTSSGENNNQDENESYSMEIDTVEEQINGKMQYMCQWPPYLLDRALNSQATCNDICGKHKAFLRPDNMQLVCYTYIDYADSAKYYRVVMNNDVQSVCECGMVLRSTNYYKNFTCENIPFAIKGLKINNQGSCKIVCEQARIFKTKRRPNKNLEWCHYNADTSIFKSVNLEGVVTDTKGTYRKYSHKCWCGVSKEKNLQPSYNAPMPEPNKKAIWLGYQRAITNQFVPIKIKPVVQFSQMLQNNNLNWPTINNLSTVGRDSNFNPPNYINDKNQLYLNPYEVLNSMQFTTQSNPYDPRTNTANKNNFSLNETRKNDFTKNKSIPLEIRNDINSDRAQNSLPVETQKFGESSSKNSITKNDRNIKNKVKNMAHDNGALNANKNEITLNTRIERDKSALPNQQFSGLQASTSRTKNKIFEPNVNTRNSGALHKENSKEKVKTIKNSSVIVNPNTITNPKTDEPRILDKEDAIQNDKISASAATKLLDKNATQIEINTQIVGESNYIRNKRNANASINLIDNAKHYAPSTPLCGVGQADLLNKLSHWRRNHGENVKLVESINTNSRDNNQTKCQNLVNEFGTNAFKFENSETAIEQTKLISRKKPSIDEKAKKELKGQSNTKNNSSLPSFVVHKPIAKLAKDGDLDVDSLRIFDLNIEPNKKIILNDINSNKVSAFTSRKTNERINKEDKSEFSSTWVVQKPVTPIEKEDELKIIIDNNPKPVNEPEIRNFCASDNRISAFTKTGSHYQKSPSQIVHKPIAKLAKCDNAYIDHLKTNNIDFGEEKEMKRKSDANDNASEAFNDKGKKTSSIARSENAGKNLRENEIGDEKDRKMGLKIGTSNDIELFPTNKKKSYVSAFKPFVKKDEANEK